MSVEGLLELARLDGRVEPEVEPLLEDDVASGKHVAELGKGKGLVGVDGREFRMDLFLDKGFHGVGDHEVGLACHDLVKDCDVVIVDDDFCFLQVLAGELFVNSAGVDDGRNVLPVDLFQSLELFHVFLQRDGGLARFKIGDGKEHLHLVCQFL